MPDEYVVFVDNLSGFIELPQLRGATLAETVQNIQEGCAGMRMSSQMYMYFIYRLQSEKVPLFGTKFDCYKYVKAVAGSCVELNLVAHREGLQYALTHQTSMAWVFTDNCFP